MPKFDVTTYGEGGLRLSVPAGTRLENALQFNVDVAGTEANVVGALSHLGWRCSWISALADTPPGRRVAHKLRSAGIDMSGVRWREQGRVSCYYVEYADPPRSTTVLYDRKESCFAQCGPEDVDWSTLLDTRHLHLSGLTVPLSEKTGAVVAQAVERARREGVTVSLDINHRDQLWSPDQCRNALLPLCRDVDLLFCSQRDAKHVFGCEAPASQAIRDLRDLMGARTVVMSLGDQGVTALGANGEYSAPARPMVLRDRMGAGDALAAGVLHGWLRGDLARGLHYGCTMAAMAMSQYGDMVVTHREELERLTARELWKDIER